MHHGLDSIAIANSKFSNTKLISWTLPWEKKQNRSDITSNKGIEIRQYNAPDVPALAAKICSPMIKISFVTVLLTFYGIMFMHVQIGLTISAILIQTIIQFQNHLQPCLHLISHYKSKFKIFSNQLNEHICPSGWLLSTFNINFYSFSDQWDD